MSRGETLKGAPACFRAGVQLPAAASVTRRTGLEQPFSKDQPMTKSAQHLHSAQPQPAESSTMKHANAKPSPEHDPMANLDPVYGHGVEAAKLWAAHREADEAETNCHRLKLPAFEHEIAKEQAWDKVTALQNYAASLPARSIPGALVHACLLASAIDILDSCVMEETERRKYLRKMKRLTCSIAAVLRAHSGGLDPLSTVHFVKLELEL